VAPQAGRRRGALTLTLTVKRGAPVWGLENALVTRHSPGRSSHARQRTAIFCDDLRRFKDGRPLRSVIGEALGS